MFYQLSRRNAETDDRIFLSKSFDGCKRYALALFKEHLYTIHGYHLSEVYNAPLHAVFYVQKDTGDCAVYTISEA